MTARPQPVNSLYNPSRERNNMWPEDEDNAVEYSDNERCGDVDREEVEDQLVEDVEVEELSGLLSW